MLTAEYFRQYLVPALSEGLALSLAIIIPSATLGFLGGTLVGVLRVFAPKPVRKAADVYVALFRGVPLLLQLYFLYYALPAYGVALSAYEAATLGFILCSAAYHSEYIRGALLSIRQGQFNAAHALGFSPLQTVFSIIVPQALRRALPGCGNEVIYLIKYSSLAHVVTYIELTGQAKELARSSFHYIEIYLTIGLCYLILTTLAAGLLHWLEKKVHIPGFGVSR